MTLPTPNLSIDLPDNITFVSGTIHTESFGQYITNNTGSPLTMTASGNVNVSVSVHHDTDVDFSSDPHWSGTETITFTVTAGTETAFDNVDVIVTPVTSNLAIDLPDSFEFERYTVLDVDFSPYIVNNTGSTAILSYSGNTNVLITVNNSMVHFEGANIWAGTETITFTVTAGTETTSDFTDVTVTPEPGQITFNLPDEITMITNTVRVENIASYIYSLYIFDITWEPTEYLNIELDIMGNAFFTVVTPGWVGTETITFTVTDCYQLAVSDSMDVTVLPEGGLSLDLPSSFTFEVNQTAVRDLSGYINEDEISFSVTGNQQIGFAFSDMEMTMTPNTGWTGEETVTIMAQSSSGGQISDDVTVIVHPVYDNSAAYRGGSYDGFDFAFGYLAEVYFLAGMVTNANTSEAIAGALISAGDYQTTSNQNGQYGIEMDEGTYQVECSAEGFETYIVENLVLDDNTLLDFQLTPLSSNNNIIELSTQLMGNYPNPFNPETRISYTLNTPSQVSISVYNLKGQKVKQLLNAQMPSGSHSVLWDGTDEYGSPVASGMFFCKMKTDSYSDIKKMMLIK